MIYFVGHVRNSRKQQMSPMAEVREKCGEKIG